MAASPSVASNTHPHTPTHSPSSLLFSPLSISLLHQLGPSYYIVPAVAMETGAAAEWQTPRVSLLFVCVFLPASVRASARVWMQMSACESTFCPGLCVAQPPDISSVARLPLWCLDKGGYCLPTSATWLWPPPPPPPPPLPPPTLSLRPQRRAWTQICATQESGQAFSGDGWKKNMLPRLE